MRPHRRPKRVLLPTLRFAGDARTRETGTKGTAVPTDSVIRVGKDGKGPFGGERRRWRAVGNRGRADGGNRSESGPVSVGVW